MTTLKSFRGFTPEKRRSSAPTAKHAHNADICIWFQALLRRDTSSQHCRLQTTDHALKLSFVFHRRTLYLTFTLRITVVVLFWTWEAFIFSPVLFNSQFVSHSRTNKLGNSKKYLECFSWCCALRLVRTTERCNIYDTLYFVHCFLVIPEKRLVKVVLCESQFKLWFFKLKRNPLSYTYPEDGKHLGVTPWGVGNMYRGLKGEDGCERCQLQAGEKQKGRGTETGVCEWM